MGTLILALAFFLVAAALETPMSNDFTPASKTTCKTSGGELIPCSVDNNGAITEIVSITDDLLAPRAAIHQIGIDARNTDIVKPNYGLSPQNQDVWSSYIKQPTFSPAAMSSNLTFPTPKRRSAFNTGKCCAIGDGAILRQGKYIMSGLPGGENNTLISPNGFYSFSVQNNGQLVIYDNLMTNQTEQVVWQTKGGAMGSFQLIYQADNNLVEFSSSQPLWSTGTDGKGASGGCLAMQNDRNLVLFDGNCAPLWTSQTAAPKDNGGVQWWVDNEQIIGSSDATYQYSDYQHGPITSITVWTDDWCLHAIQVTHYDGFQENFGPTCDSACQDTKFQGPYTLNLGPGERITYLSLYGNGAGSRTGAIHIKTSAGQDFFPQMYSWGLKTEYPQPVGSGIIGGIQGYFSTGIFGLGFIMVRKNVAATVEALTYGTPEFPLFSGTNLGPGEALQATVACKRSPDPATCIIGQTVSAINSYSYKIHNEITVGINFTISGGVPFIVKDSIEVSIEYTHFWETTSTSTVTVMTNANYMVTCPANTACTLTCTLLQIGQNIPYSGTAFLTLDNGNYYAFAVTGEFSGNLVSSAQCQTVLT